MTRRIRLTHTILAALTGIQTLRCGCGFETRCGTEFQRHGCES